MVKVKGSKHRALAGSVVPSAEGITIRVEDNGNSELWTETFISFDELRGYLPREEKPKPAPPHEHKPEDREPPKTELKPLAPKK